MHRYLHELISQHLPTDQTWELKPESDDVILFEFPRFDNAIKFFSYFAPSVKVELGARSDHFPVENRTLSPYLHDAFPEIVTDAKVSVRVLSAERTFWEKATILHAYCHCPSERVLPKRLSRHFYDLYQMIQHSIADAALEQIDLLARVAQHKSVFFKSSWSHYETAKIGTLRLIPNETRLSELRRDYADLQPMFFREVPKFHELVSVLKAFELRINQQV